ncbi:MAG: DUF3604 domain-containing protein [Oligoflexia bacterium]|nr:DUF3604 domain-containing protein [Oligoflexia bacterium]
MWVLAVFLGCGEATIPGLGLVPSSDARASAGGALAEPLVQAFSGDVGGFVWVRGIDDADAAGVEINVYRGGVSTRACTGTTRCYLTSRFASVQVNDRATAWRSERIAATPINLSLTPDRTDASWWADESPTLTVGADALPTLLRVHLSQTVGTDPMWYLDRIQTWVPWPVNLSDDAITLPPRRDTAVTTYTASVGMAAAGWDIEGGAAHHPVLLVDTSSVDVVNLGFTWGWGDLHAHSDLSHDGCRDPASDCVADISRVGMDFFDSAIDEGLDFAAITDHSSWATWSEGGGSTDTIDIWDRTQDAVTDTLAAHPDFIPLLGYEWTASAPHPVGGYWPGGHRVVFFEDTTACEEARLSVGVSLSTHSYTKGVDGAVLYGGTPYHAVSYTDLVDAMDTAVADCGITGRVQMVPHHPAYRPPAVVDWANPDNVPDSRYTTVVEIYGEHGSSECADASMRFCNWRQKSDADYLGLGGYQTALALGYELGVVGGTDSHDGLPGTIHNDPSCTAIWDPDTSAVRCQDFKGGLTGVMVTGRLSRTTLFDALFSRNTVATSGPKLQVRAYVRTTDNQIAIPGDEVTAADADQLVVSVEGLVDGSKWEHVYIDLIDPTGVTLASTEDEALDLSLATIAGDVLYVRLRLYATGDTEGERMWLSPWFFN